jgi:hypothetical protein
LAAGLVSACNSDLDVACRACAALSLLSGLASGLLALELALGLCAVSGLDALVVALQLLADGLALGFWGSAGNVALSGLADVLALGALILLANLLGAADRALGLVAMNGALGAGGLLALHLAVGALANGVALGRALGVVALPLAVGVALLSGSDGEEGEDNNGELNLHFWYWSRECREGGTRPKADRRR